MFKKLHCSFCGKDETKVAKLVAGPSVYICNECVEIANQIIKDSSLESDPPPAVQTSIWKRLPNRVLRGWYVRARLLR